MTLTCHADERSPPLSRRVGRNLFLFFFVFCALCRPKCRQQQMHTRLLPVKTQRHRLCFISRALFLPPSSLNPSWKESQRVRGGGGVWVGVWGGWCEEKKSSYKLPVFKKKKRKKKIKLNPSVLLMSGSALDQRSGYEMFLRPTARRSLKWFGKKKKWRKKKRRFVSPAREKKV